MHSIKLFLVMLLTATMTYMNAQEPVEQTSDTIEAICAEDNAIITSVGDHILPNDEFIAIRVHDPDRTSTDSAPLGGPAATFSVSGLGAATYSIPIEVPKGINGMEPELSLVYNSQGGNDVVGWGFGLSCMSAISFVPKDIHHDGVAKPLHYDFSDPLALDGKRLILKSGTHGVSGAVYTPEGDPYTAVKLQTDSSTGKLYFLVEASDGMRYYYGRGTSLYTLAVNGTERYVGWYLSACFDRHGTGWSCTYTHTGNGMLLNGIYYDDKVVSILYENRTNDPQTYYVGNIQVTRDKRVKTIRVKKVSTGEIYRTYTLGYDTTSDQSGTKYSRLVSVTESNGSGESRKPVLIEWNRLPGFGMTAEEKPREQVSNFTLASGGRSYTACDINGDGISDPVYIYQGMDQLYPDMLYTHVFVFPSSRDGNGNTVYITNKRFKTEPGFHINGEKGILGDMGFFDIDGDGVSDICMSNIEELSGIGNLTKYTILTAKHMREHLGGYVEHQLDVTNHYSTTSPLFTHSDFDHDGRSEIFHLETGKTGSVYKGYYIYNTPDYLITSTPFSVTLPSDPKHLFSGDFNGDGQQDVVLFCESGYKVFINQGGSHGTCPFDDAHSYTGTGISYRKRMVQGDFNGDGLTDFIANGHNSENYYLVTCNGDGTFSQSSAISLGLGDQRTRLDDDYIIMAPLDLNHDEKTDLLVGKAVYDREYAYSHTEFRWFSSTGSGFTLERQSYTDKRADATPRYIFAGDFTGSGQTGLINYGSDIYSQTTRMEPNRTGDVSMAGGEEITDSANMSGHTDPAEDPSPDMDANSDAVRSASSVSYDIFHKYTQPSMTAGTGRMKKATDSNGNVTVPSYAFLTDNSVYTRGSGALYPVCDVCAPLSVVRDYTEGNGAAGTASFSCRYDSLKVHQAGKGLLGYMSTAVTDNISDKTVTTTLSGLDNIRFEPLGKRTVTRTGNYLSTVCDTFRIINVGQNYRLTPMETRSTDIYGNVTRRLYSYDTSKGVITADYQVFDNQPGMVIEKDYGTYELRGGAYRPTSVTTTTMHPDTEYGEHIITQTFTYNNYGELTSTTENANTSLPRTTSYTYDAKGNVLTKSVQTGADTYMTTNYTYADYRTLTSTSTSPSSSTHTYTYDLWSRPLNHTETYGDTILTTVNTYDGWGNLSGTVSPDGVSTTYTRGWGSSAGKKYYVLEERQGAPWVKTWYDSRGREVLTESVGPAHTHNDHYTYYDNKGQVVQRKEVEGNRTSADTLTYDALGRVISERHTAGGNTTYSYGNRTVTAVTNGITLTKTLDAWGNVRQAMENGTAVSYSYAPNGKPKSVTSCGHTVTIAYDDVGNRTSLTDPDAGTSTWEYDNNGRVTRHTDARGKVTQTWYDAFGNREQENVDGVMTKYYYDTPRRHVVWETCNGRIRRAAFDIHGRLLSTATYIRNSEGTIFKTYTYDSYGRVQKNNYTFGTNVNNVYDEYGYKTSMTVNGKTVWRMVENAGRGEIYKTLNDSILNIRTYDHAGRMLTLGRRLISSEPIMPFTNDSITYTYNSSTGNLMEERSYLSLTSTVYTYDNLDRLVSVGNKYHSGAVTTIQQQTYGNDGNILSKTGLGSYTYGSSKPHAVTGVENTGGIIPQTPQDITYNAFGKVSRIESGGYTLDIDYGSDRQRWRSTVTDSLGNIVRSIRYCEDEELVTIGDSTLVVLYFDGGIVYVRGKNSPQSSSRFYQITADRLGSVLNLVDGRGNKPLTQDYDAWGRPYSWNYGWFTHGYTGHEMLPEFGLINMNGRVYDPVLGRFLSPDDYVQMPLSPQGFNRYTYCNNNPLKYTDPSGEIFFLPIITGAVIGAVTSAITYSISAGITNSFSWSGFFKSMGMGAVSGAISGIFGSVGMTSAFGKFSNSLGFNLLSQTSSTVMTNTIYGNKTNLKGLIPAFAGALAGTALPKYKATYTSWLKNFSKEIIHNTLRGVGTGFVEGLTSAAIYKDPKRIYQCVIGGAISGFGRTIASDIIIGVPIRSYSMNYGIPGEGTYRSGGLFKLIGKNFGYGLTIGSNYLVYDESVSTEKHEWYHIYQQYKMGWSSFYGRISLEYINHLNNLSKMYENVETLEGKADLFENQSIISD